MMRISCSSAIMRDDITLYELKLVLKILVPETSFGIRFIGGDGFMISHHQIIPTGEENLAGLAVLYNKTNPNATIICDCKLNDCQYFNDTNAVHCLDANGKRIQSSSAISSLFIPFIFLIMTVDSNWSISLRLAGPGNQKRKHYSR